MALLAQFDQKARKPGAIQKPHGIEATRWRLSSRVEFCLIAEGAGVSEWDSRTNEPTSLRADAGQLLRRSDRQKDELVLSREAEVLVCISLVPSSIACGSGSPKGSPTGWAPLRGLPQVASFFRSKSAKTETIHECKDASGFQTALRPARTLRSYPRT